MWHIGNSIFLLIIGFLFSMVLACTDFCEICLENSSRCLKCINQNYFLQDGVCHKCSDKFGCESCDPSTALCISCKESYYQESGYCMRCSEKLRNCAICFDSEKCIKCASENFYLKAGECRSCKELPFCKKCSTTSALCISCESDEFFLKNGKCLPCKEHSNLENKNSCSRCRIENPDHRGAPRFLCIECKGSGYFLNALSVCVDCKKKIGCAECNPMADECTKCIEKKFVLRKGICSPCSNIKNCLECDGERCFACIEGYYLYRDICIESSTKIKRRILADCVGKPYCSICDNLNSCTDCISDSYYLELGECYSCSAQITNCLRCSDKNTCIYCASNSYYLSSGACFDCTNKANCATCAPDLDSCTACNTQYYLSTGTCESCFDSSGGICLECSFNRNIICTRCVSDAYYLALSGTCIVCNDKANCLKCDPTASSCVACDTNYYLDIEGNCILCSVTIQNCLTCSSSTICTECASDQFYLNSLNTCSDCSSKSNCQTCNPKANECTSCISNLYTVISGQCLTCDSRTNCYLCSSSACLECISDSYYLDDSGACQPCSQKANCLTCSKGSNACVSCLDSSYYLSLDKSECIKCSTYGDNTCKICTFQNLRSNTGFTCLECISDQYYLNTVDGACTPCSTISNCNKCSPTSVQCVECVSTAYYLKNGACESCALTSLQFCSKCSSDINCLECLSTSYELVSGQCQLCSNILNCESCSPTSSGCASCINDQYYLGDGVCSPCSEKGNCLSCDKTSNNCLICQSSYYLENQSRMCILCSQSIPNCLKCSAADSCSECASNSFFLESPTKCTDCSTKSNCNTCDPTKNECQSCIPTTMTVLLGDCVLCNVVLPDCLTCSGSLCTGCSTTSFYLKNGACLPCSEKPNCDACNPNADLCDTCKSNYYLNEQGSCSSCESYGGGTCKTCSYTIVPNSNSNIFLCSECISYNFFLKDFVCNDCISKYQCSKCSPISDTCQLCSGADYYLENGECLPCISKSGCLYCNPSQSACTQCISDQYFLEDTGNCQPCSKILNCAKCSVTSTLCLECVSNQYYLQGGQCFDCSSKPNCIQCNPAKDVCLACASSYLLSIKGICELCSTFISNCLYCSSEKTCTECKNSDFFLEKPEICSLCSSKKNCVQCNPSANECVKCLDVSGTAPYKGNCEPCTQIPYCGKCDSTGCIECITTEYYIQNSNCLLCSSTFPNCKTCGYDIKLRNAVCTSCSSGQYYLEGNTCYECSISLANCGYCSSKGTCVQCSTSDYYLKQGSCFPCKEKINCAECSTTSDSCIRCSPGTIQNSNGECLGCDPGSKTYFDAASTSCKPCDSSCLTCSGPMSYNCKSCSPQIYFYNSICYTSCPLNTYPRLSDNTCQQCSSVCASCESPGDKCKTCPPSKYLLVSTCVDFCVSPYFGLIQGNGLVCKEICPSGQFKNVSSRTCQNCDLNCKSCVAAGDHNCTECAEGKFLTSSGSCQDCDASCKNCFAQANNCTECAPFHDALSLLIGINSCSYQCDPNCISCRGPFNCSACASGFYLYFDNNTNKTLCQEQVQITGSLIPISNPRIFRISFSAAWPEYFDQFVSNTLITISNMLEQNYFCSISKELVQVNSYALSCNYKENVTSASVLKISFLNIPKVTIFSPIRLKSLEVSTILDKYIVCSTDTIWDQVNQICRALTTPVTMISPFLRLTDDARVINLIFNKNLPPSMSKDMKNCVRVYIPSLNKTNYNFTISNENSRENTYNIEFNFSNSVKSNPQMYLELLLPAEILADETNKFSDTILSINLMDYYALAPEEQKQVIRAGEASAGGITGTFQTFVISNIFTPGRIYVVKGMVIIQLVQLLRFVRIQYPPNVKELFQSDLLESGFIKNFNIKESIEDGLLDGPYYQYGLSTYVLNNCGPYIVTGYIFMAVGIVIYLLKPLLKSMQLMSNKNFALAVKVIGETFVWNFFLTHFVSQYQTLLFLLGVSIKFPTNNTDTGRLNMAFAALSILFLYSFPFLVYFKVKTIRLMTPEEESVDELKKQDVPYSPLKIKFDQERQFVSTANDWKKAEQLAKPGTTSKNTGRRESSNTLCPENNENIEDPEEAEEEKTDTDKESEQNPNQNKRNLDGNLQVPNPNYNNGLINNEAELSSSINNPLIEREGKILESPSEIGVSQFIKRLDIDDNYSRIDDDNKGNSPGKLSDIERLHEGAFGTINKSMDASEIDHKEPQAGGDSPKRKTKQKEDEYMNSSRDRPPSPSKEVKEVLSPLKILVKAGERLFHSANVPQISDAYVDSRQSSATKKQKKEFNKLIDDEERDELKGETADKAGLANKPKPISKILTKDLNPTITNNSDQIKAWEEYKTRFKVFQEEFKENSWLRQNFLIFEFFRQILIVIFLLAPDKNPYVSMVGLTVINSGFFLLLIYVRPFKELKTIVLSYITEALLIVACIGGCVLADMDEKGIVNFDEKMSKGWIMVYANLLIVYIVLITQLIGYINLVINILKTIIKDLKERKRKKIIPEVKEENC